MTYSSFMNQCIVFGDQSLAPDERWKSIKFLHTVGQKSPMADIPSLLETDAIRFDTDTELKGFTISVPYGESRATLGNAEIVFINISTITAITFKESVNDFAEIAQLLEDNEEFLEPDDSDPESDIFDELYNDISKKVSATPDQDNPLIDPDTNKVNLEYINRDNFVGDPGTQMKIISGDITIKHDGIVQPSVDISLNDIEDSNDKTMSFDFNIPYVVRPKIYGVKFTGGTNPGVRTNDAVGKVAGVGTDTETAINDFDNIYPWSARKRCCGMWNTETNEFIVNAYAGEPDYAVDGSNGEVWVEHSIFYYRHTNDEYGENIEISDGPLDGFDVAPIFINPNDINSPFEKAYTAAYPMAIIDDVPTSRSGVISQNLSLNDAVTRIRTIGDNYTATTTAEWYTECLYMWVEFATRNIQAIMAGATNMPYNQNHIAIISETAVNRIIVANSQASLYLIGQTINIGTVLGGTQIANYRIITSIDSYDIYNAIYFTGTPVNIDAGNILSSSGWINGSCDNVITSSGSPVSNISGKYNCIYRGKESPYGNDFEWISDMLFIREGEGTEGDPYIYGIYYLPDPTKYANGDLTSDYIKLNYTALQESGYVKTLGYDSRFSWIRIASSIGANSSTYYSAYYTPPASIITSARFGGRWTSGDYAGLTYWVISGNPISTTSASVVRLSYFRK